MRSLWLWSVVGLVACGGGGSDATETDDTDTEDTDTGSDTDTDTDTDTTSSPTELPPVPLLGDGDEGNVEISVIGDAVDQLSMPSDLDFHPDTGTLWVTNRDDDSIVVFRNPGEAEQSSEYFSGGNANHFLAKPAGIAFSSTGDFATIHEEDELTQGVGGTPADFMGPTLWTGKLHIFDGGHSTHLDMLHNTPNGVGIASAGGNAYFTFDGYHNSITWYDFREDHDLGGADHSDGQIHRWVEGEVSYVEGVGSHLEFVAETNLLYIADSGNNRIAVLDTTTGSLGGPLEQNYDGLGPGDANFWDGAEIDTLVDGVDVGLEMPSGLAIDGDILYVGDHATGMIHAFTLDGVYLTGLDLGVGAGTLQGIAVHGGAIWFTDEVAGTVNVIRPVE